jgi:hypothetical protein
MSQYCFRRGREHIIRDDADNVLLKVKKGSYTQSNVRLIDATGDGVNTATLAGHVTLVAGTSARIQRLNADGVARNVTLPAHAGNAGLEYVIVNTCATHDLVVKNVATATIITINPAEVGWVFCDGTAWYGVVMSENALAVPTLQQAFAAGNEINTADGTPKLEVGDGTDSLLFYTNSSVPTIATDGTSNLVIAPDGGGTTITGTLDVSGDVTIGSTKAVVTAATGAITLATGASITLDTNKFTVDASGNTACAGTLAATGNISGTFIGTVASTATLAASTWAANPVINLSATAANGVTVNGQSVTSGSLLYLACDSSLTGASGNFLKCYNDTTLGTAFQVASDGAVTIGGTAAATSLVLNAGDLVVSAGGVDIVGAAVIAGNAVDIEFGAGASTGDAINIAMGSSNVAGGAIVITAGGVRTDALIDITDSSTSNSPTIEIANTGIRTGGALSVTYGTGAATEDAITLNMGTNVAGRAIYVSSAATGATHKGACFDVVHTGALAADADVMRLRSTGSISSTSNVLSIVQDTGAGTTGAYGLHIACSGANVEAINVAAGKCTFAETCTFADIAGVDATLDIVGLGAAAGGAVTVTGGAASGGIGGAVGLVGGAGSAAQAGGAVTLTGGAPASGSANGGAITISSGAAGSGGGNAGVVGIDTGTGAANVINIGTTNATDINIGAAATTVDVLSRLTTTDGVGSGTAKVVGGRAYSKIADTTSTETTNEEVLGTYTVPANTLKEGSVLRVRFGVFVTSKNAADTLTVKLKLGATEIYASAATNCSNSDVAFGEFTLIARAAPGAAAACSAYGLAVATIEAAGTAAPVAYRMAPTNFATNGALVLAVTSTWSAAHANNDATCEFMEVEIL